MLLKWLFTLLAIIWLYQALRPMLAPRKSVPPPPPPPSSTRVQKSRRDDDDEYIDYEEIR
jgi:hypothetical protein